MYISKHLHTHLLYISFLIFIISEGVKYMILILSVVLVQFSHTPSVDKARAKLTDLALTLTVPGAA